MLIPRRHGATDSYRYGFQGQEKDDEVKGEGNSYNFGSRSIYDGRVARFISLDPDARKYPSMSPYAFAANNPIFLIDYDGRGPIIPESWWKGKTYAHGFLAGIINTGVADVESLLNIGIFGTLGAGIELGYENHKNSLSNPLSRENYFYGYGIWGEFAMAAVDDVDKGIETVELLFKDKEVREKFYNAVKESIGEFKDDATFQNSPSDAGYAHGQLLVRVLETLGASKNIQAFLKTGRLSISLSQKWSLTKNGFSGNKLISNIREVISTIPQSLKKKFECDKFASALMDGLKDKKIKGTHLRVENIAGPNVISKKHGVIGESGFHEAILIDDMVFDNMNPNGIEYSKWIDDLDIDLNYKMGAQYIEETKF
ncbi:papain fold toxin domain-containing protein [Winogradskyella sp. 3972H.M.0a.05]|uniref:papain fold toxin domain-containing protein n=1 Tax=Winogradskyella sp. 3972H.M.0a.05 TaxID=2950277 RepID=UPI003399BBE8